MRTCAELTSDQAGLYGNEGKPGWFSLVLSFRYIDRIYFRISLSAQRLGGKEDKVMAGETPANLAALDQ